MSLAHCKKCNNKAFATLSELRRHQWKTHRESFNNLLTADKNNHKRDIAKAKQEIAQITAAQLLERLKVRRDFMKDIVDLVEGIMKEK